MTDLGRVLAAPSKGPALLLLDLINSLSGGTGLLSVLRERALTVTTQACLAPAESSGCPRCLRSLCISIPSFREVAVDKRPVLLKREPPITKHYVSNSFNTDFFEQHRAAALYSLVASLLTTKRSKCATAVDCAELITTVPFRESAG